MLNIEDATSFLLLGNYGQLKLFEETVYHDAYCLEETLVYVRLYGNRSGCRLTIR